ncbi:MAG: hypothetical protein JWO56_3803 [Acidobacteria bacterium]|nr:hypothetical protein [Acidobacteriota bacterium]
MAEPRDLENAAAGASTALAHYLLRTSIRSARTIHLFEQVIGCVARKQLDPESLRETLTRTLESRGSVLAMKTAESHARFFGALATTTWLPADETEAPPFEPPPFEIDDPIGWFGKLAACAAGRNARAAFPDRPSLATFLKHGVPEHLADVARNWFELLGELEDSRGAFMEEYLQAVLANVRPIGFHAGVLDLAAPLGQLSSTELVLGNERGERISIRCAVSDIRRADGVGPAFPPAIMVTPAELLLDPDADAAVRLSLTLDEAIYVPNAPYIGALHILRDGQPHADVPLRITASARAPV